MQQASGITKYNLNSVCISRILEIGDKDMIETMKSRFDLIVDFIMVKHDDHCRKCGLDYVKSLSQSYLGYLKTYKPYIPKELLIIMYKNGHNELYNYILSKNLHVPK